LNAAKGNAGGSFSARLPPIGQALASDCDARSDTFERPSPIARSMTESISSKIHAAASSVAQADVTLLGIRLRW
jgi:hypothetical protein